MGGLWGEVAKQVKLEVGTTGVVIPMISLRATISWVLHCVPRLGRSVSEKRMWQKPTPSFSWPLPLLVITISATV